MAGEPIFSEPPTELVPFTQYVMPNGHKRATSIEVSSGAASKARQIMQRGLVFECEVLTTGDVSLTITDPEDGDQDIRVVPNGPGIREAVEDLILNFRAPGDPA